MSSIRQPDDFNARASSANAPDSPVLSRTPRRQSEPPVLASDSAQFEPLALENPSPATSKSILSPSSATSSQVQLVAQERDVNLNAVNSHEKLTLVVDRASDGNSNEVERREAPLSKSKAEISNADNTITRRWTVHDVRNFTDDYDGLVGGLDSLWESEFDGFERPKAYERPETSPQQFLPLTDPNIHVDILKDASNRTSEMIYAATSNAAHTLKIWQDEYLALENLIKRATRSTWKKTPNPREFEDPQVFEDKKEAVLYGYRYDSKVTQVGYQNPFVQGGFLPTAEQNRKMKLSGKMPWKIDGWEPVIKDGMPCVPKLRTSGPPKVRKRQVSKASKEILPKSQSGPKRLTRYGGSKFPPQDDSQIHTAESSPSGSRVQSRQASVTPQRSMPPLAQAPLKLSPSKLHLVATRSPLGAGPSESPAPISTPSTTFYPDPLQDPKNQLKIRQSKHPKRTEAMILHWAKFNKEGRTRNPKRTKAQIEADRAAAEREGSTRTPNSAMSSERKRKSVDSERFQMDTTPLPVLPPLKRAREEDRPTTIPSILHHGDNLLHLQPGLPPPHHHRL